MPYKDKEIAKQKNRIYCKKFEQTPKRKEYLRKYRNEHKEQTKKAQQKYKETHSEEIREQQRKSKKKHREERAPKDKEYREKHKEHYKELHRNWRENNPELVKKYNLTPNKRKKSKESAYELTKWFHKLKEEMGCAICGYNEYGFNLEFHHLNGEEKKYGGHTLRFIYHSPQKYMDEFEKCILLCKHCHRVVHNQLKHYDDPEWVMEYNKYLNKQSPPL